MWTGRARLSELQDVRRWKVERFSVSVQLVDVNSPFGSVSISDIAKERQESADPMIQECQNLPYIGLENIEPNSGELIDVGTIAERGIRSRSKIFKGNDVLYGRLRAYLNKVYIAEETIARGLCSGEFYVLSPIQERVAPEYLRWVLASPLMVEYVRGRLAGATHPRLGLEDLMAFKLVLPPLTEQEKIVQYIRRQRQIFRDMRARLVELPSCINKTVESYLRTGSADMLGSVRELPQVKSRKLSR